MFNNSALNRKNAQNEIEKFSFELGAFNADNLSVVDKKAISEHKLLYYY
jgi:hypothetical protein